MSDVFLSYAREDFASAEILAAELERDGLTVWWDRRLLGGEYFHKAIEEQIDAARCVVVLWSRNSIKSEWVINEAGAGLDRDILVPARIDDAKIPLAFRARQTVDWLDDDSDALIALVGGIRRVLDMRPVVPPPGIGSESSRTWRDRVRAWRSFFRRTISRPIQVSLLLLLAGLLLANLLLPRFFLMPAARLTVATVPDTVGMVPGTHQHVAYRFNEAGGVGARLESQDVRFLLLDGTELKAERGVRIFGGSIALAPGGSATLDDNVYLPPDIADVVMLRGMREFQLETTYRGGDDNGHLVHVRAVLRIGVMTSPLPR